MALGYFSEKFYNGKPIEESWMNRTNALDFSNLTNYDPKYKPMAGRYNVGETTNFLLSPIMLNGLKQINKWGVNNIEKYCEKLANIIISELRPFNIKFEEKEFFNSHLFSLGLPNKINPKEFKRKLDENQIFLSLRGKSIRVSINVFNNENDIERLISIVKNSL